MNHYCFFFFSDNQNPNNTQYLCLAKYVGIACSVFWDVYVSFVSNQYLSLSGLTNAVSSSTVGPVQQQTLSLSDHRPHRVPRRHSPHSTGQRTPSSSSSSTTATSDRFVSVPSVPEDSLHPEATQRAGATGPQTHHHRWKQCGHGVSLTHTLVTVHANIIWPADHYEVELTVFVANVSSVVAKQTNTFNHHAWFDNSTRMKRCLVFVGFYQKSLGHGP